MHFRPQVWIWVVIDWGFIWIDQLRCVFKGRRVSSGCSISSDKFSHMKRKGRVARFQTSCPALMVIPDANGLDNNQPLSPALSIIQPIHLISMHRNEIQIQLRIRLIREWLMARQISNSGWWLVMASFPYLLQLSHLCLCFWKTLTREWLEWFRAHELVLYWHLKYWPICPNLRLLRHNAKRWIQYPSLRPKSGFVRRVLKAQNFLIILVFSTMLIVEFVFL